MAFLICGIQKEMIQMNVKNRKRLTDSEKELMVGGGGQGVWEGLYTLLYLKWVTNKDKIPCIAWGSLLNTM